SAVKKAFASSLAAPGPVPKGHIRLFSMRLCPFAQRTRLVLAAKGIKYVLKLNWFLEKNPLGLVPTLETEKKLLPTSPFGKAPQRMMREHFSKHLISTKLQWQRIIMKISLDSILEAVGILLDDTPELKKWFNRMKEDPAVKGCSYSTETYQAFMKTAYIDGKPDYDYGL
uniref:GST N-terminal domain-containing protein n=1 Tax=Neogobius melanostomus TaxID=47308 RepID=A0A8C6TPM9_9GOBI